MHSLKLQIIVTNNSVNIKIKKQTLVQLQKLENNYIFANKSVLNYVLFNFARYGFNTYFGRYIYIHIHVLGGICFPM